MTSEDSLAPEGGVKVPGGGTRRTACRAGSRERMHALSSCLCRKKRILPLHCQGLGCYEIGFVPIFLPPCDQAFRRPLCPSCEDGMQHADVLRLRFELPRQTLTGHSLGRRCDAGA